MLLIIKRLLQRNKDYAGRNINQIKLSLATQSGTDVRVWRYIKDKSIYENTENGMRIYPYEVSKYAL